MRMRPLLRISFSKFWPNFDEKNNIFYRALSQDYDLVLADQADIAFYSVFPGKGPHPDAIKVSYTGEPVAPDLQNADCAFSFDYDEAVGRRSHLRLPLYTLSTNIREFRSDWGGNLVKSVKRTPNAMERRKHFCAYVAFHDGFVRCLLFDRLNRKKPVTAPGRSRNNAPPISMKDPERSRRSNDWQDAKRTYLRDFRFSIVCENTSYPGYTTEKLVDAMIAGCLPIYWGNPEVCRDFNTRSFVYVNTYEDEEAAKVPSWIKNRAGLYRLVWRYWVIPRAIGRVVKQVISIDRNQERYRRILEEPWFEGNQPNIYFDYNRFFSRVQEIAEMAIDRHSNDRRRTI